jgi:outer membrane protein TolC
MKTTGLASPSIGGVVGLTALALVAPVESWALQPLAVFVDSARVHNPDNEEARAGLDGAKAQADVSLGRALPNGNARGVYTRNQFQFGLPPNPLLGNTQTVYLQKYNQLDAFFTINVPLIDLGSFERISASRTVAEAAGKQVEATTLQVSAVVAQDYFRLVANQALVTASERALEVAKKNLQLSETRFETGKGAALDVDLARAGVERQTQVLVATRLQVTLAAQALESATGVTPDLGATPTLEDDLHDEAGLDSFQRPDAELPAIAAASINREAAEQQAFAQRLTLVPALAGVGSEHGTNAASFIGQPWSYYGALSIFWQLDYSTFAAIRAQDAAVAAAHAREERVQRAVRDAIRAAWAGVSAAIAESRSARAQQQASGHASELAQVRYEAGRATELEMLRAQDDAFAADVARIQADADLANARLQLRLAAGIDPFSKKGTP